MPPPETLTVCSTPIIEAAIVRLGADRARMQDKPARFALGYTRPMEPDSRSGAEQPTATSSLTSGLDHVYYWVTDMDRAVAFYRDVVGLPLIRRSGDEWAEFDAGAVRLALHGAVH